MKKLVLFLLTIVLIAGCTSQNNLQEEYEEKVEEAEEIIEKQASDMTKSFVIETAFCDSQTNTAFVTIRNVGEGSISSVSVSIDGENFGDFSTSLSEGKSETFEIEGSGCETGQRVDVTIESGLSKPKIMQ